MKIYFDGCSWTWGAELKNPEEERFTKIVCDKLGADESNFSKCGGSNDRIVRNLLIEKKVEDYDLAVIQMTYPARTEYWNADHWKSLGAKKISGKENYDDYVKRKRGKWEKVSGKYHYNRWLYEQKGDLSTLKDKFTNHKEFWKYYYVNVANETYFVVKEKIQYETIKAYCKSKNVPLILCTINNWSKLDFDVRMDSKGLKKHPKSHPTKEGHQRIAASILGQWQRIK